jgi:hypothetical protein
MAKRACLQANATNTSTSATATPAANIKMAGTNTGAADTNAKQLACLSLQLCSLSDNKNVDSEHPACKHRQTTMSSAQPPAPELHTCIDNNNKLLWVVKDLDKDNSLYDNNSKGGDMQDESGEND